MTLVNVLRIVLRYYFGAELPPVPDEQSLSGVQPYKFYRVDTLAAAWAREGPTRPDPVSIDGATGAGARSGRTGRVPPWFIVDAPVGDSRR